jgi:uncharacterized protein (UPF0212 family)
MFAGEHKREHEKKHGAAMPTAVKDVKTTSLRAKVYCTLCTRTVEANARLTANKLGKRYFEVLPGQRCPRCSASLDAAFVFNNLS